MNRPLILRRVYDGDINICYRAVCGFVLFKDETDEHFVRVKTIYYAFNAKN